MRADVEFDHYLLSAAADPHPEVARLREQCPVAHTDAHDGYWVLSTYDNVWAAALDTATFSSSSGASIPPSGLGIPLIPLEVDPPRHTGYRRVLGRYLLSKALARFEEPIRAHVRGAIDTFAPKGSCDISTELLFPMATYALGLVFGLPAERGPELEQIATSLIRLGDTSAAMRLYTVFAEVIADRKANPADDLPSGLVSSTVGGVALTDEEIVLCCFTIFGAGLETVASAGAHMLAILAEHPADREVLCAEPTRIPQAVEELLRLVSPLPAMSRTATKDVVVGDHQISAGERVLLMWIAANRDPEVFADPGRLNFDRDKASVAFGVGPHRCIGAHLARLELRIMLEELLNTMPDYRITDPDQVVRFAGAARGVASMPISFTASSPSRGR
ncbi:cytochrome P450 [Mycolicibacterium sphagni]|uniref:Cytochrome P450 n=1 Tax=Mycolicibacterium sphagni TaxID=1786 RepID=A0A255DA90_9MYCO|nr:cytochrome P450 [Mycolicibacterium sphagni]OYN76184.1 hypothetical protein CG716_22815 [Mycolicibacterium sphagni]